MPVHVIDSPANRPAIESIWNDRRIQRVEREVTVFRSVPGLAREEYLYAVLRSIAPAHASPSDDRRPRTIDVLGLPLTPAIEAALRTLGFGQCRPTADGFRMAIHPSAGADKAGS